MEINLVKKALWSKQSWLLKIGSPDRHTRLINVQSYVSHVQLARSWALRRWERGAERSRGEQRGAERSREEQRGEGEE